MSCKCFPGELQAPHLSGAACSSGHMVRLSEIRPVFRVSLHYGQEARMLWGKVCLAGVFRESSRGAFFKKAASRTFPRPAAAGGCQHCRPLTLVEQLPRAFDHEESGGSNLWPTDSCSIRRQRVGAGSACRSAVPTRTNFGGGLGEREAKRSLPQPGAAAPPPNPQTLVALIYGGQRSSPQPVGSQ